MTGEQRDPTLRIGPDELRIRGLYETISIVNDVMVALWFIVGSVRVHLGRIAPGTPASSARDF